MKHPLSVADAMSEHPHSIGLDQHVARALERMRELGVRHLPVLEGGTLVGVLSERDAGLALAAAPESAATMRVEEAMSAIPYCVPPSAPLREVVEHMATRKLGCAVVADDGHILGLLTTTDALRVLGAVLEEDGTPAAPAGAASR